MIIKKIFDGSPDENVHASFLRFGRGEYKNKYLIEGKKQAKKWAIKTSAEYTNSLVKLCLEKVNEPIEIKGVIVSTLDLRDEINFDVKKVSNFQGVRKHVIDSEINPSEILELIDKYPKAFFALSFKGNGFVLKIKPKAPKAEKKPKDGEEISIDFCSLKTEDKKDIDELFFGVGDFKEVFINHTINVNDIIYPSNMDELKPTEIRELAKRKGKIIRKAIIDEKEYNSEKEFIV